MAADGRATAARESYLGRRCRPDRSSTRRPPTARGGTGTARLGGRGRGYRAARCPVVLAGGLDPANVAEALRTIPAVGVDVASGVEAPRVPGERPRKDPFRVALFVKRAKAARDDRPNTAFGPTPVHPALLEADAAGRWGMERDFGGRYVPETLMAALEELEAAYAALRHDPVFWADLRELLARFAGRPTALYRADRLARAVEAQTARLARDAAPPEVRLYLKREDLAHTGRAQDQQRARPGAADPPSRQDPGHRRDRRGPARRRHGHRVRAARAAVRRVHGRRGHRATGPERAPHARARRRGAQRDERDGDAQGRGQRGDARLGHERRDDPLRARLGDGPAPVPDDRARSAAADRRRGRGTAPRRGGSPPGPRDRLRRRGFECDRAAVAVHRRAVRAPRGRGSRG